MVLPLIIAGVAGLAVGAVGAALSSGEEEAKAETIKEKARNQRLTQNFNNQAKKLEKTVKEREKYFASAEEAKAETRKEKSRNQKLTQNFKNQAEKLDKIVKEREKYFASAMAMISVGAAAGNCSGRVSAIERKTIKDLVIGQSQYALPKDIDKKIKEICDDPPNLQTAYRQAQNAKIPMDLCREIIEIVIAADGKISNVKRAFVTAWERRSKVA